jgi:phosphoribosylformimino-5-aminoimidazole carboxamide ribotide isomerase
MIFLPAIDLKDGACVRLVHGDMAQVTVFDNDPAARARQFAAAGCEWLHVVDLNGAFAGRPVNGAAVAAVLSETDMKIELGGGIRDMRTAEDWLNAGVTRIVLGTAAVKDPDFVRQACRAFPGKIVVGIDALHGLVAVEGWAEATEITVFDLACRFVDAGVAALIHTEISRDGAMQGPDVAATVALALAVPIPVILSGGVSSMADLEAVVVAGGGVLEGVISGRAIYDGRIDLTNAVRLLAA